MSTITSDQIAAMIGEVHHAAGIALRAAKLAAALAEGAGDRPAQYPIRNAGISTIRNAVGGVESMRIVADSLRTVLPQQDPATELWIDVNLKDIAAIRHEVIDIMRRCVVGDFRPTPAP